GPDEPVQILGLAGRRPIGRIDLMSGEIVARGEKIPVVWGSALDVPEEFRATGIGLMLFLRMQTIHPAVTVCGVSHIVKPLYAKLRWTHFRMPRWILMCRSRPLVEKRLGTGAVSRALSGTADLAIRAPLAVISAI